MKFPEIRKRKVNVKTTEVDEFRAKSETHKTLLTNAS